MNVFCKKIMKKKAGSVDPQPIRQYNKLHEATGMTIEDLDDFETPQTYTTVPNKFSGYQMNKVPLKS